MLSRGTVYEVHGSSTPYLLLTRDSWNSTMTGVGMVPLIASGHGVDATRVAIAGFPEPADVSRIQVVPQQHVTTALHNATDAELAAVAGALARLIDAPRLLADPLRANRPVPGPINYARQGEIYYRHRETIEGQRKRYLVVSNDLWNSRQDTVLVVRTTSQPKHPHSDFPLIQGGVAQAAAGELVALRASSLDLDSRPSPDQRASLADMRDVVKGICMTHQL